MGYCPLNNQTSEFDFLSINMLLLFADTGQTQPILLSYPQDNSPAGTSVLTLIATDKDSSKNGPPFNFQIMEGNEDSMFQISPDGVLSTTAVLSRGSKEKHVLKIKVSCNQKYSKGNETIKNIKGDNLWKHSQ